MKRFLTLLLAAGMAAAFCTPAWALGFGLSWLSPGFEKAAAYTPGQFTDVPAGAACEAEVRLAVEYGVMEGRTPDRFEPDSPLTAAEAVVAACRLYASYHRDTALAATAAAGPWYQPYLDYAAQKGIACTFADYDAPVTRADFAVVLSSALPDQALRRIGNVEDDAIPDVKAGMAYADAVYRLYRAGVLAGNDARGTFAPDATLTRAETAAIVARVVEPGRRAALTLEKGFEPVPVDQLANLASLRKKCTDAEFQAAYDAALELVRPLARKSRQEQLKGIAQALRERFDRGMTYSTSAPHYNDPYGYLVLGTASCAGCTRATGLCLNILGIPYEHVNENQWGHQWCRVNLDGKYWICDAYGLYCGEEPAPYRHPVF